MDKKRNAADNRRAQLFKGLSELALLSLLRQRPHYGLELLQRLWDEAEFELAEGTIYPLLYRLEHFGRVASEWRSEPSGSRPKKYYKLTKAGAKYLDELQEEWRDLRDRVNFIIEGSS